MSVLLETKNLSAQYGKIAALNNVNIQLAQGQVVTVIGANGAGKSTLLNTIMGSLVTSGSAQGDVVYQGHSIMLDKVETRMVDGISLVPERRELFASMTVQDNLLLGGFRRYLKRDSSWKDTLEEIYALFPRLKERQKQLAGTLSGGERQMLAVGRAMMGKPKVLMLDEPSLGLAPLIVREIFHIIMRLRETGVSILLVEQNARSALQVADYGYVLEMGEVTLEGNAKELLHNPAVIESYLGFGGEK
ncbi:ABC transporter ATP-binding protein [Pelistega europaea]|uniref:ABC transporter ATP-binding protein n=1 Tax=Pelistega europaea TaxID=106147 RepID=A0A7Y4P5Y6_9BURK|nr:ABC transporter ATP-binding protein [Pelistega europaea]NOL49215.1 ABC transporter ATP-binding protein [Pelistega europaea]